jgi:hypothetical protein
MNEKLNNVAIPVLHLPSPNTPIEGSINEDSGLSETTLVKRAHHTKILTNKSKMEECSEITHQQFLKGCDKFLSPDLSKIVKTRSYLPNTGLKTAVSHEVKFFCCIF